MASKKSDELQAYVQWGQIREDPPNVTPFSPRRGYHNFDDFVVMNGNSEAREALRAFQLSKQLREMQVSMAVLQPSGSTGDYYFGFLYIQDWEQYKALFETSDNIKITWSPPPEIKSRQEKEEGEKDSKDDAPGWRAIVMEENSWFTNAPLMVMLRRPMANTPLHDKKIRAAVSADDDMPVHKVYIKTFPSAITVKARLKALDLHRSDNNSTKEFDEKRRILVGRDLSVNRKDDLLEGVPNEDLELILANLTPSQTECLEKHCRDIHNGVNLILGPFGSGKTVIVSKLCQLQTAKDPKSITLVAASASSACDAVVPKFEGSNLMVIRAHPLSLGKPTLFKPYFKASLAGNFHEAVDEESGDDESEIDVAIFKANIGIMKLCEEKYRSRFELSNPKDPRMQQIGVAIHTWILKIAEFIAGGFPKPIEDIAVDQLSEFQILYAKSKQQQINDDEWGRLKKATDYLAEYVLKQADVIIATTVQGQMPLLKNITFKHVIFEEASNLTHCELLCCWRGSETMTMIGDFKQLPTTVLSRPEENPFALVQAYGPFQRFADLAHRVFLLKDVMRMTKGLEEVCNTVFYKSQLVCGPGTSVDHPSRLLSRLMRDNIQETLPQIQKEPEDCVYPVFIDIRGICYKEKNSTSRVNPYNIAIIIDTIQRLFRKLQEKGYDLRYDQIGIASPYAAQARATREALKKANMAGIRVGVTESFQGGEKDIMFVDLVRARNPDEGRLGFLSKKERLNVLLSRQKQFLFVVGDIKCCGMMSDDDSKAVEELDEAGDDAAPAFKRNDTKNRWLIKVLQWFQERGRVCEFDIGELPQDYITFLPE